MMEKANRNDKIQRRLFALIGEGKRRGFILRGGEYDYERGAKALIDDFRKGRIGKICLENPNDYKDFEF